jgi:hypothetical protein
LKSTLLARYESPISLIMNWQRHGQIRSNRGWSHGSAPDLARIGATSYRGVQYKGRSAWQSWLADGLGVDSATIRRWLMDEAASRRSIPRPLALLLIAANRVSDRLQMRDQPRGTLIVDRMAEIALEADGSGR